MKRRVATFGTLIVVFWTFHGCGGGSGSRDTLSADRDVWGVEGLTDISRAEEEAPQVGEEDSIPSEAFTDGWEGEKDLFLESAEEPSKEGTVDEVLDGSDLTDSLESVEEDEISSPDTQASQDGTSEDYAPDGMADGGVCPGGPPPDPGDGSCVVFSAGPHLLLIGDIDTPSGFLRNGQVLVNSVGLIECVSCDCSGHEGFAQATRIECRYGLITPGLINAHDHITYTGNDPADHGLERYDHRHEWRKGLNGHTQIVVPQTSGAVAWGEVRQVMAGTTSLFGSGGVGGLVRNLDKDSSGLPASLSVVYDTFPLGDSSGVMLTDSCAYPAIQSASSVASMHCYIPHVSEGVNDAARNEFLCLSSFANGGQDLVRPNTAFIHGVGLQPPDIAAMAAEGTGLVWSPRSNIDLYGNTAPVTVYARLGVRIALGTDWTASGSMNILRELRCADSFNRLYLDSFFSDRDLLDMVTIRAAEVMHLDSVIGAIKEGLIADISVFDTHLRQNERAVIEAGPQDVVLVLRAGLPLYGDAGLVAKLEGGGPDGCEDITVCGRKKRLCVKRETGKTLAELKPSSAYPLFFCGEPDGEPSCTPFRPGEYDGIPKEDDMDGDGIVDKEDLCPRVFSPIRPVDHNKQPDWDGDGIGDACDPCPLIPYAVDCKATDPNDLDGDGIPVPIDNCPMVPNPGQEDTDGDAKGDACDPCPLSFNPGLDPCPATIYEVKSGATPPGTTVRIGPSLVTGIGKKAGVPQGYFLQVAPSDQEYAGPQYSGLYVYDPAGAQKVAPGDRVIVAGTVQDYYGQTQLAKVTSLEVLAHGEAAPEPLEVAAADVATGGALAKPLEGVLVKVTNALVIDVAPLPGPGDQTPTNEFVIEGGLRVDDFIYLISPFPSVGQVFESLSGILRWANGNSKLEPRGPEDVVTGPAKLVGIEPEFGYVLAGSGPSIPVPSMEVLLSGPADTDIFIEVHSEDEERLVVEGGGVVIPAGAKKAPLVVSGLLASPEPVGIRASLGGTEAYANVRVVSPDEVPSLAAVEPRELRLVVGEKALVLARLDIPAFMAPINLSVASLPSGVLSHPQSVDVAVDTMEATFEVQALAGGTANVFVSDGTETLALQALVSASPSYGLLLSEVYYDHPGTDDGFEWVELLNASDQEVDLSAYSLGMGGTDYTVGRYQLQGIVPPWACIVVGGPQSVPANGSPSYFQVLNFDPDLQNSGATADGIALFSVLASEVTKTTVPIDAVIYGGQNTSNLMDATGKPGPVMVGDAPAGKSISRQSLNTWAISDTLTPGLCEPLASALRANR